MSALLDALCSKQDLSFAQSQDFFARTVRGEIEPVELAATLIALRCKGESATEVHGAAHALLASAQSFTTPDYDFIDCCGTGGDGLKTLNISTAVAFVLAAMGVPVAKHGNRAVSSQSGSTDVLTELGIPINLTAADSRKMLDAFNLCFLHAPQYHPGVKHAMPVRQALKVRTLFNLLGPIINPAKPTLRLIGIYDKRYLMLVAQTLRELNVKRALVVNGEVDEIAIHTETDVVELNQGEIRAYKISPESLGIKRFALEEIAGRDSAYNAEALRAALSGKGSDAYRAAIAVNAAAGLYLAGRVQDIRSGVTSVNAALSDGVIHTHFQQYLNEVRHAT